MIFKHHFVYTELLKFTWTLASFIFDIKPRAMYFWVFPYILSISVHPFDFRIQPGNRNKKKIFLNLNPESLLF